MKYLGETFDLHAGGVDLVFPHHENEIAQSEAATGKPFVRHWFHVEHLLVENETMSKSKGNVFNIPEVLARGYRADALRYLLLGAHYRTQLNFTWEGLQHATAALDRIHSFVQRLAEVDAPGPAGDDVKAMAERARAEFDRALTADLNTPEALAAVFGLVNEGNALLAAGRATREGAAALRAVIEEMNSVFAVFLPEEAALSAREQALFDERQDARRRRDFAAADAARKALEELGVVLEDTAKGTRWRRR
jgi:cysteinyl-tRNA synthetase